MDSSTNKLKPDFSHRITDSELTARALNETVTDMVSQATSVLNLLATQFTSQSVKMNDDINFWAIESAIKHVEDIGAVVHAYLVSTGQISS